MWVHKSIAALEQRQAEAAGEEECKARKAARIAKEGE